MSRDFGGAARRGSPLGWLALLLAGQGATLALLESGKAVTYQHYMLERAVVTTGGRVGLALLALQLTIVAWGLCGLRRAIAAWIGRTYRPLALVVAAGVLFATSAAPSRDVAVYATELLFAFTVQLVALGCAVLMAVSFDDSAVPRLEARLARSFGPLDGGMDRLVDPFAVVLGGVVTVACAALAFLVFERLPHLPDEIVYLLHARYFAEGVLQLPAPPVAAAFDVDLMYYGADRWFSPVPPGWPAILAVGVKLGAPWLVNPILSGVCVVLLRALLGYLASPRTARVATLFLAASPWFLFLGMSLMTHTATLACALAAALGVARARAERAALPAALAGVATGMVGLIRPLEGLALALVLGLWSLTASHKVFRLLPSAALTATTVLVAALVRPYNAALTGAASRFPIMMYVDKYYAPGANDLGFGPNRGMGWGGLDPFPGHGARDVVVNNLLNGFALNVELLGWAAGSLLPIVALLAAGRLRRLDWAMVGIIVLIVGLHALYWFSGGPDFGARYWYLIIVPCIVLAVRSLSTLFGAGTPNESRATVAVLALSLGAVVLYVPWRAVEKYYRYRAMGSEARTFVAQHPLGRALVLVRGRRHPDYHQAALENPLDLRANTTIFAWDRTAEIRRAVVAVYADRPVYIVDGPTITGDGFHIVAGPLAPGSVAPSIVSSADIPKVVGDDPNDGMQRRTP